MKKVGVLLGLVCVLLAVVATAGYASAFPSAGFYESGGDISDDWEICRTRAFGEDGFYQACETTFRPVIAFESLGEEAAVACSLGEQFAAQYPDPLLRAEKIFCFVRDRVNYTPDMEQFKYDEFAQNADELVTIIEQNGTAHGDCEDCAVLLAVMYKAAGYRSAIVVGSGHTAALVYLPEYKKAAAVFKLEGEPGWGWAEATGGNNPLGWVPKEFINVRVAAYEIGEETIAPLEPSEAPSIAVAGGGGFSFPPFSFMGFIALLWLMSLFRRRR
jgi:hypothetical protein